MIGVVSELGMKLIGFLLISTLFAEGLVEDGGKGGIQLFLYILKQYWTTKLHSILKCAQEVRLLYVNDLQVLRGSDGKRGNVNTLAGNFPINSHERNILYVFPCS